MRIAYVTPFQYPSATAMTRRIGEVCSMLRELGHEIIVASGGPEPTLADSTGVAYMNEFTPVPLLPRVRGLVYGRRTHCWLRALNPKPDAVVQFGGSTYYTAGIQAFCRSIRCPHIIDVVEWFKASHLPGGRFGPVACLNEIDMCILYPRARNIIAISRFLQEHFAARGCNTCRIPMTSNSGEIETTTAPRSRTVIAYAGFPGRKDLLAPVIQAVTRVDPNGDSVRLRLIGPSKDSVKSMCLDAIRQRSIPGCIEAPGTMSSADALSEIKKATFTILVRPPERYAVAGFPTKVCDSLSAGTPVICTHTGDLAEYVQDGIQGIVCPDASVESVVTAVRRAACTTDDAYAQMRKAARATAVSMLDRSIYIPALQSFLERI